MKTNKKVLEYGKWKIQRERIHGLCYTFSAPKEIKALSIASIRFHLKNASSIFYHHPGYFSRTDGRRQKIRTLIGDSVNIDLYYDVSMIGILYHFLFCFPLNILTRTVNL